MASNKIKCTGILLCALTFFASALATQSVQARSKAAQYLIDQEIEKSCDTKRGTFAKSGIIEADLTGDGRSDLVLDHGAIKCSDGSRSGFCGAAMCRVNFYVRNSKGLLKMVDEVLSIGATLKKGNSPGVELFNQRGESSITRWNGRAFE